MNAEMSLVFLTMSKDLVISTTMVDVRSVGQRWVKPWAILSARGRIWWSGLDGNHVGWVKEEPSEVLVAEGVPGL